MPTQIRKFEQDAIINSIYSAVEDKIEAQFEKQKSKPDFTAVSIISAKMLKISDKIKDLEKERSALKDKAREHLKNLNSDLDKCKVTCGYCFEKPPELELTNSWHIKSDITNRVAISLLPKDAINNLDSIQNSIIDIVCSKVTKEFA